MRNRFKYNLKATAAVAFLLLCLFLWSNRVRQERMLTKEEIDEQQSLPIMQTQPNVEALTGNEYSTQKTTKHSNQTIKQVKKVLLVANYRSGSSFLGSIFSVYPGSFYIYEPLKLLALAPDDHSKDIQVQPVVYSTMNDLLNCRFDSLLRLSREFFPRDSALRIHWYTTMFKSSSKVKKATITHACNKSVLRVIKIIRCHDLSLLQPLVNDDDAFIIRLIRDPRGMIASRIDIEAEEKGMSTAEFINKHQDWIRVDAYMQCARYLNGSQFLMKTSNSTLQSRVRFIRYEDLAYSPVNTVVKLLSFLKLQIPEEVMQWLNKSTIGKGQDFGKYAVEKNSSFVAEHWQEALPLHVVKLIENQCASVLTLYGYNAIKDRHQLQKRTSLVAPTVVSALQTWFL